jgi:hypothetical protein
MRNKPEQIPRNHRATLGGSLLLCCALQFSACQGPSSIEIAESNNTVRAPIETTDAYDPYAGLTVDNRLRATHFVGQLVSRNSLKEMVTFLGTYAYAIENNLNDASIYHWEERKRAIELEALKLDDFLNDYENVTMLDSEDARIWAHVSNIINGVETGIPILDGFAKVLTGAIDIEVDRLATTADLPRLLDVLQSASNQFDYALLQNYGTEMLTAVTVDILRKEQEQGTVLLRPLGHAINFLGETHAIFPCMLLGEPDNCLKGDYKLLMTQLGLDEALGDMENGLAVDFALLKDKMDEINANINKQAEKSLELQADLTKKLENKIDGRINRLAPAVHSLSKRFLTLQRQRSKQEIDALVQRAKSNLAGLETDVLFTGVNTVSSLLTFLSSVDDSVDPRIGQGFAVAAKSGMQIVSTINKLNSRMASIEVLGAAGKIDSSEFANLSNLASAAASLNIVMAAVQVFSFVAGLAEEQVNPHQIILDQIVAMRRQLSNMRIEMHERFDRIDKRLIQIYDKMDQAFAVIAKRHEITWEELEAIQFQLARIESTLTRMNIQFTQTLGDIYRKDFDDRLTDIGWKDVFQAVPVTAETFRDIVDDLTDHAIVFAAKSPLAGPNYGRDYSDGAVCAELGCDTLKTEIEPENLVTPLSYNINYLNQYAVQNLGEATPLWAGHYGGENRLCNPTDWMAGAQAVIRAVEEYPEHRSAIDAEGLFEPIIERGTHLVQTFEAMGDPDRYLALWNKYRTHYDQLNYEIAKEEQSYRTRHHTAGDSSEFYTLEALDLWGGPYQMSDSLREHYDPHQPIPNCRYDTLHGTAGYGLHSEVLNDDALWPMFVADHVKHRDLSMCWDYGPGGSSNECSLYDNEHDRCVWCKYRSSKTRVLRVHFSGIHVATASNTGTCTVSWNCEGSRPPCDWTFGGPTIHHTSAFAERSSDAVDVARAVLRLHIRELYQTISQRFGTGHAIGEAANVLDGAKAILKAYAVYGLPELMPRSDTIRGMLFGGGLPDGTDIGNAYKTAVVAFDEVINLERKGEELILPGDEDIEVLNPVENNIGLSVLGTRRKLIFDSHLNALFSAFPDGGSAGGAVQKTIRQLQETRGCLDGEIIQTRKPCGDGLLGYEKHICSERTMVFSECVQSPDFDPSYDAIVALFANYLERSPTVEEIWEYRLILNDSDRANALVESSEVRAKLDGLFRAELGRPPTAAEEKAAISAMKPAPYGEGLALADVRWKVHNSNEALGYRAALWVAVTGVLR